MRIFELLDVGAKTWQANAIPPTNPVGLSPEQSAQQPIRRTPSFSRLSTHQHKQLLEEHNRKLKERRIAELTAQLESTVIQHQPQQSQTPPLHFSPASTPHMPTVGATNHVLDQHSKPPSVAALGPQAYFTTKHELLLWRQKQKEAEELNARIENLRRSGMPEDQLPSPVRLPITPLLADLAEFQIGNGSRAPTSAARSTRPSTPVTRAPSVARTPLGPGSASSKRAGSKTTTPSRAVEQSPGLIMTAASVPAAAPDRSHLLTTSSHDQSSAYFNALKDAEAIITQLRSSHDNLLIKVTELESQLDQVEAENENLKRRNQKLEGWLADSEKEKARAEEQRQREKMKAEQQSQREAQARADAQVRADNLARAEAQARAEEAQDRAAQEQAHARAHHRAAQIPQQQRYPHTPPSQQPVDSAHQQQSSREAQLRAKLQLKDFELGKQFARQPFNLPSSHHPELVFANGPPLAHHPNPYYDQNNVPIMNGDQRLKRSTSFSGPTQQPRSFQHQQVYTPGMNDASEALQMAMEKHQEALNRIHVQGVYTEDVYGEVEWPLNGHQGHHNMTYGPHVETYHHLGNGPPLPRQHR